MASRNLPPAVLAHISPVKHLFASAKRFMKRMRVPEAIRRHRRARRCTIEVKCQCVSSRADIDEPFARPKEICVRSYTRGNISSTDWRDLLLHVVKMGPSMLKAALRMRHIASDRLFLI